MQQSGFYNWQLYKSLQFLAKKIVLAFFSNDESDIVNPKFKGFIGCERLDHKNYWNSSSHLISRGISCLVLGQADRKKKVVRLDGAE